MKRTFTINIEASWNLEIKEIWPDGDAPENPTAEDVKNQMETCGTKARVLRDWELLHGLQVDVDGVTVWA